MVTKRLGAGRHIGLRHDIRGASPIARSFPGINTWDGSDLFFGTPNSEMITEVSAKELLVDDKIFAKFVSALDRGTLAQDAMKDWRLTELQANFLERTIRVLKTEEGMAFREGAKKAEQESKKSRKWTLAELKQYVIMMTVGIPAMMIATYLLKEGMWTGVEIGAVLIIPFMVYDHYIAPFFKSSGDYAAVLVEFVKELEAKENEKNASMRLTRTDA